MKITETIERDCCAKDDMLPVDGFVGKLKFCTYCGQIWKWKYIGIESPGNSAEYQWRKVDMNKLLTL